MVFVYLCPGYHQFASCRSIINLHSAGVSSICILPEYYQFTLCRGIINLHPSRDIINYTLPGV